MKLPMLKSRGHSITVIGAISQERGLVHFKVFDASNNAQHFSHFITGLKLKCKVMKVAVVQDNLRIHQAKIMNELYDRDFQRMLLPPYSCELNPIERLWSVVKRRWTQGLFHFTEELTRARDRRSIQRRAVEKLQEILGK